MEFTPLVNLQILILDGCEFTDVITWLENFLAIEITSFIYICEIEEEPTDEIFALFREILDKRQREHGLKKIKIQFSNLMEEAEQVEASFRDGLQGVRNVDIHYPPLHSDLSNIPALNTLF